MAARADTARATEVDDPTDALLSEMLDLTSIQILGAATGRIVTVRDLAHRLTLPMASLYRRVRALQAAGALTAERQHDAHTGKDVLAYTSRVATLQVDLARSPPTVQITFLAPP